MCEQQPHVAHELIELFKSVSLKIKERKFCFYFSTLVTAIFVLYLLGLVAGMKESTSGLWFFVIPKYAFGCFFVAYGLVWSIENLFSSMAKGVGKVRKKRNIIFSVMYLSVTSVLVMSLVYSFYLEAKAKSTSISPREMWSIYESHWAKIDKNVLLALAGNISVTPEILHKLYHDPLAYDVSKLKSLRALLNGDFRPIKVRIAGNVNTSREVLEKLGDEDDWYIQKALALNKNTPKNVRQKLWDRGDIYIRNLLKNVDAE